MPGIIVVTKIAGSGGRDDKYLLSSRKDVRDGVARRRDQSLESPQGLIPLGDYANPVHTHALNLLCDEAEISEGMVEGLYFNGLVESPAYGDFALVFTAEVDPAAHVVAATEEATDLHYNRQWFSADEINEMQPNVINPAVYNALKVAGVVRED